MHQLILDDILSKRIQQAAYDQLIYQIHFGSTVFYIGQSKRDIVTRLWEHLNKPSRLGQLIQLNQPDSSRWLVTFYTLADCRPYVQQKRLFQDQAWEHYDMDMAEQSLIAHFRPVANVDFNPRPSTLPPQFNGHHLFAKATHSLFNQQGVQWQNKMRLSGWVTVLGENGRIFWKHASGKLLNDEQIKPYQEKNTIPKA